MVWRETEKWPKSQYGESTETEHCELWTEAHIQSQNKQSVIKPHMNDLWSFWIPVMDKLPPLHTGQLGLEFFSLDNKEYW